jgi:hypothetical protein
MCQPCPQADTSSTPSSIGGTSLPTAPPSTSDNSEATQKYQAQLKNAQLPTKFNHWDGKNLLLAPTWAKTMHSAATLAINNVFHTQTDELLTILLPFYRITPVSGVNSQGMFEISTINPMEDYEVEIKRVTIAENSDDRATQQQTRQKIDFPVAMFSDFIYLLHQLEEHAFPPATADCTRTFSVSWKTDLKMYKPNSYAKLYYTLELQMVVLPGTTGTERMVRFTQFMNGKHTIVQFPWVHLNRIFKLFAQTNASIKQANYAMNENRRKSKQENNRSRQGRPQPFMADGHTGRNSAQTTLRPDLEQTESGLETSTLTGQMSVDPGPTLANTGETPPPNLSSCFPPAVELSSDLTPDSPWCSSCIEDPSGNTLRSRLWLEQCGPVKSPVVSQTPMMCKRHELQRRRLLFDNYHQLK